MTDESKLMRQSARAERAKQIVEDELFQEAFSTIEQQILDAWKASAASEREQRDNAYLMIRLLQNFREQFIRTIATGEAAGKELLRIRDPSTFQKVLSHGRRR